MKNNKKFYPDIRSLINFALLVLTMGFSIIANADSLYIGDGGDDSVKRFDAKTGVYQGDFVVPGSGGLHGPRGLIFTGGSLNVVNQNVNTPFNGAILRYDRNTGDFINALIPASHPQAPLAPRGLIRGSGNKLYVADFDFSSGKVENFNATTGVFLGNLDTTGFSGAFIPRGIVRGPDDLLYVTVTGDLSAGDGLTGYVLRFNPQNGKFVDVFTSNADTGCATHLHRPEGLVFGPDEKLYVTSFRSTTSDTDKVLIFNSKTKKCIDHINLASPESEVPGGRAFAQAIIFGPKGRLFVPINGGGIHAGEVRRYDVKTKTFDIFVPSAASGGSLQQPWYLTFGETDPRTLEYDN